MNQTKERMIDLRELSSEELPVFKPALIEDDMTVANDLQMLSTERSAGFPADLWRMAVSAG